MLLVGLEVVANTAPVEPGSTLVCLRGGIEFNLDLLPVGVGLEANPVPGEVELMVDPGPGEFGLDLV